MPTAPLASIDSDRFPDPIIEAWQQAGLDESITWVGGEQYRLRVPATDPEDGVTTLAGILDQTPQEPRALFVHLALGRQAPFGPQRRAVESFAGQTDVVATGTHTAGTASIDAFETLVGLGDVTKYALIRDGDGRAIAEWRGEYLRFVLPSAAVDSVRADFDVGTIEPLGETDETS
jgi:hypothetical protein